MPPVYAPSWPMFRDPSAHSRADCPGTLLGNSVCCCLQGCQSPGSAGSWPWNPGATWNPIFGEQVGYKCSKSKLVCRYTIKFLGNCLLSVSLQRKTFWACVEGQARGTRLIMTDWNVQIKIVDPYTVPPKSASSKSALYTPCVKKYELNCFRALTFKWVFLRKKRKGAPLLRDILWTKLNIIKPYY